MAGIVSCKVLKSSNDTDNPQANTLDSGQLINTPYNQRLFFQYFLQDNNNTQVLIWIDKFAKSPGGGLLLKMGIFQSSVICSTMVHANARDCFLDTRFCGHESSK